ncbi:argininosuccinate lyase [Methyloglobulus sp.]|uniref:argininosuccinate lyase n=1 Tax=Methyloglobulus sp. TaxID=2518622 RepID=UPI0032B86845
MTGNDVRQPVSLQEKILEIGTRLKSPPSDRMVKSAFTDELSHQVQLFEAIGLVDIAHTLVAIELGTIPKSQGHLLLAQLLALQTKPPSFVMTPDRGDIYTNREAWLAERTETVGWLGAGRARREATTTAFILVLRQTLVAFIETLIGVSTTLVSKAGQHSLSIMPDYTYLQAAQPTTFGHYLLGFAYPLLRDLERLEAFLARLNLSPMGCGSTNGSRLLQGRQPLAALLGFNGVVPHARDAMWQADLFIEAASILTTCSINLSRLAEDLQVYSTQEFGLVELNDHHARASKIMPHKKNPFALTHIRGVANKMIGLMTTVTVSARTPSGQPDNRLLIYGELPDAMQTVNNTMSLMTEVLEDMTFNAERGRALVASGWVMSTDLAEALVVECGLDFRRAHQLVAFLANEHQGKSILELELKTLVQCAERVFGYSITLTEQQLKSALDVTIAIQARTEPGGTAIGSMNNMIAECRQKLADHHDNNQSSIVYFACKQKSILERAMKEVGQNKPCPD